MSSRNFQKPIKIPGRRRVITKKMIEDSQSVTKSNAAAARWLSVHYLTYRMYNGKLSIALGNDDFNKVNLNDIWNLKFKGNSKIEI